MWFKKILRILLYKLMMMQITLLVENIYKNHLSIALMMKEEVIDASKNFFIKI